MIDDISAIAYPPNAAADITNGRIQPDGTVRRRPGSQRTHATVIVTDGTGYGGILFTTAGGTEQLIAFIDNKAHKSENSGSTWTEIATGLREDYYSLVIMRVGATNYLFAANGDTTVKRWDGTTWDTIPNAPSGVKYIAEFNRRLWYAGHSGVIAQATKVADPTIIASPDGLTVQVRELPTGLYQIGPHLLVFGEDETAYIDGYGRQDLIVATGATGFSRSVGCIAFRTIQGVGENAVCWLSKRGIEYYTPGSEIMLVSRGLQSFFQTIDRDQILANSGNPSGVYDEVSQEYWCALSTTGAQNNRVAVVNLLHRGRGWLGACSVDELSGPSSPAGTELFFVVGADGYLANQAGGSALRLGTDGYLVFAAAGESTLPTELAADGYFDTAITDAVAATLFVGPSSRGTCVYSVGYDGFVRRHDDVDYSGVNLDDVRSDDTLGIAVELGMVSRPFLRKAPSRRKRVRAVQVASINDSAVSVTVAVRAAGATLGTQTVTIPLTAQNQPQRKVVRMYATADSPQVEVTSEADVRIALIGTVAEVLREQIG